MQNMQPDVAVFNSVMGPVHTVENLVRLGSYLTA